MKKAFVFLLFFTPSITFAQVGTFNIGGIGAVPTYEFQEAVPGVWGAGLAGSILVQPFNELPIYLGADFHYIIYGTKTEQEEMYLDGFLEEVDVTRNNNMLGFHLVARVMPDVDLPIQPYGELMLGSRYIYTRSVIKSDNYDDNIGADTELGDWALSYGGSGGFNIFLSEGIYLDLKLTYLAGSEAEYLTRKSVTYDEVNDELVFDVKRSRTDLFIPHIGVSIVF